MKKLVSLLVVTILCMLLTISVFAENEPITYLPGEKPTYDGAIEKDVYDLLDSYENGAYLQNVTKGTIDPEILFSQMDLINGEEIERYVSIYDIKKIDSNTYSATRISLEQEQQGITSGVVIYNRIVNVGNFEALKLTKVKGGVVRKNGDYWCEALKLRYNVHGDAYTSNGTRVGYKGVETSYGPNVGSAYVINGPNDYYYHMGVVESGINGFTQGKISKRLTSSEYLEVTSSITSHHL